MDCDVSVLRISMTNSLLLSSSSCLDFEWNGSRDGRVPDGTDYSFFVFIYFFYNALFFLDVFFLEEEIQIDLDKIKNILPLQKIKNILLFSEQDL